MNSASVDLIYLDPPFNKGRAFHAPIGTTAEGADFSDIWTPDSVKDEWHNLVNDKHPTLYKYLDSVGDISSRSAKYYLIYMAVRLIEMERILKSTGSIYLHCDPTASHYLKLLMDTIFGHRNFRNEIVWERATSRKIDANRFGNVHDTIFFYSRTDNYRWHTVHLDYDSTYLNKMYRRDDKDGRGLYTLSDLTQTGWTGGESGMTWRGISMQNRNKHWITPTGKGLGDWIVENVIPGFREIKGTLARLDALDEHNLIYWPNRGKGMPRLKRYLSSVKGPAATDIIENIAPIQGSSREKTGYPTQKPIALLDRIIQASSNEHEIVLDPFCGCATTCVSAEKLKRQWIGIDVSQKAYGLVIERLNKEVPPDLFKGVPVFRADIPTRTDIQHKKAPTLEDKKHLYGSQSGNCAGCKQHFPDIRNFEIDHYIPKSQGGSHEWDNLQLLCGHCNRTKGDRPMEYLRDKMRAFAR